MARTCTICHHENKHAINKAIINGQSYRDIAHRFSVSRASIQRHAKNHLPEFLLHSKKANEIRDADSIIKSIIQLEASSKRIQKSAENENDFKSALMAIREQSRLIQFRARLLGEINSPERSRLSVNHIENVNVKALLIDPKSRAAIELLASKAGEINA